MGGTEEVDMPDLRNSKLGIGVVVALIVALLGGAWTVFTYAMERRSEVQVEIRSVAKEEIQLHEKGLHPGHVSRETFDEFRQNLAGRVDRMQEDLETVKRESAEIKAGIQYLIRQAEDD